MGLFSSIKKAVSKTWGGIKGAVKSVAATVKKVSKKVAYAIPGGKQLWDLSSKIGKGVMKGIGKITSKLGPIGTMALSFVLAPLAAPMLSAMWGSFGAGAASMAANANTLVSAMGVVGKGIYATGNFIGGTLGAMGNALTEGAAQVASGNFSGAVNSFATNMSNAFTGKAGMASVNAASAKAAQAAGQLAGTTPVDPSSFQAADFGDLGADMGDQLAKSTNIASAPTSVTEGLYQAPNFNVDSLADQALYGKDVAAMSLTDQHAFTKFGTSGVKAINAAAPVDKSFTERLTEVAGNASTAQSLLGGGKAEQGGFQPYVAKPINSAQVANAGRVSGQGSAGFSLLGGVQGLEESLRRSQSMMFG